MTTWSPLLEGDLRDRALEAVDSVARSLEEALLADEPGSSDVSLAGGLSGWAILHHYLGEATAATRHRRAAAVCLERAREQLAARTMRASLYSGFTGIAWVVEHLRQRDPQSAVEEQDPNEEIDRALGSWLARRPWRGHYDLIGGLVGLGVYALERPNDSGRGCLESVIERLSEMSRRDAAGVTWWTPAEWIEERNRGTYPGGYYNLGVAHGVPGVVGLLGGACAAGRASIETQKILRATVSWLLRQRLPEGASSRFGCYTAPGVPSLATRTAWCYGDLGIAASLLCAARGLGEDEWRDVAVDLGRHAAVQPHDMTAPRDPALCHGTAGVAHLFNRFFHDTEDERFRDAAILWYRRTLDLRREGEGVAGFSAWKQLDSGAMGWQPEPGLLGGAAGIALALLAAATPIEPEWDRMLLISAPVRH